MTMMLYKAAATPAALLTMTLDISSAMHLSASYTTLHVCMLNISSTNPGISSGSETGASLQVPIGGAPIGDVYLKFN